MSSIRLVVCEHFAPDVQAALRDGAHPDVSVATFPARCGRPRLTPEEIAEPIRGTGQAIFIGGCCLPSAMDDVPATVSVRALGNCFHLLMNAGLVDDLVAKGAYLASPGWLQRWRVHMQTMGLDQDMARQLFGESTQRVILLDTQIDDAAQSNLEEFADYTDRPRETWPVGLDVLRGRLCSILAEHDNRTQAQQVHELQAQAADHAMAADLVGRLVHAQDEDEASALILDTFGMLFAPSESAVIAVHDGATSLVRGSLSDAGQRARIEAWAIDGCQPMSADLVQDGFAVRLARRDETLGVVVVQGVAFPENLPRYLALVQNVAGSCALCLENARRLVRMRRAAEVRRELEASLERSQRLQSLSVQAGGVAHHLNNALMAIGGYASIGQEGLEGHPDALKAFRVIEDQTARATEMSRRMLHFVGWGVRGHDLVEVVALVRQVADQTQTKLPEGCTLSLDTPTESLVTKGQPDLLQQAVQGVLTNAAEAMEGRQGTVSIRLSVQALTEEQLAATYVDDGLPAAHYIRIDIADQGCGMDEDTQAAMFEPFFSTKFLGRGLDLAATLGIVRAHNGAIAVRSAPGQGTTVSIFLLCVDDAL